MTGHAQSSQNNKFAKFLQYLKKEVRPEFGFWPDKYQSFLQVNTIILLSVQNGLADLN